MSASCSRRSAHVRSGAESSSGGGGTGASQPITSSIAVSSVAARARPSPRWASPRASGSAVVGAKRSKACTASSPRSPSAAGDGWLPGGRASSWSPPDVSRAPGRTTPSACGSAGVPAWRLRWSGTPRGSGARLSPAERIAGPPIRTRRRRKPSCNARYCSSPAEAPPSICRSTLGPAVPSSNAGAESAGQVGSSARNPCRSATSSRRCWATMATSGSASPLSCWSTCKSARGWRATVWRTYASEWPHKARRDTLVWLGCAAAASCTRGSRSDVSSMISCSSASGSAARSSLAAGSGSLHVAKWPGSTTGDQPWCVSLGISPSTSPISPGPPPRPGALVPRGWNLHRRAAYSGPTPWILGTLTPPRYPNQGGTIIPARGRIRVQRGEAAGECAVRRSRLQIVCPLSCITSMMVSASILNPAMLPASAAPSVLPDRQYSDEAASPASSSTMRISSTLGLAIFR